MLDKPYRDQFSATQSHLFTHFSPDWPFNGDDILWQKETSLVSHLFLRTTEELLGRKSSGSALESRQYGHRDPSR
jgi:hypothetical protein